MWGVFVWGGGPSRRRATLTWWEGFSTRSKRIRFKRIRFERILAELLASPLERVLEPSHHVKVARRREAPPQKKYQKTISDFVPGNFALFN